MPTPSSIRMNIHGEIKSDSISCEGIVKRLQKERRAPFFARQRNEHGSLPIHSAIKYFDKKDALSLFKKLVRLYPEGVKCKNKDGQLPIHKLRFRRSSDNHLGFGRKKCSDSDDDIELIKYLLEIYPESVYEMSKAGYLPLHLEFEDNSQKLIGYLIEKCPDWIKTKDGKGNLPLHYIRRIDSSKEGKNALMKLCYDAYPNAALTRNNDGELPLHTSIGNNSTVFVKYLIKNCPNWIKTKDGEGNLPLHWICRGDFEKCITIIKLCFDAYPDAALIENNADELPLHVSFEDNSKAFVKYLIENCPDWIKTIDSKGNVPLHWICRGDFGKCIDIVKLCYDAYPAAVFIKNNAGKLPLHRGRLEDNSKAFVTYLIDNCPDWIKTKDCEGNLPLHWVCRGDFAKCIGIIKLCYDAYPIAALIKNNAGELPFHIPLGDCSKAFVEYLIDKCPHWIKIKDDKGNLPLHWQCLGEKDSNNMEILKLCYDAYPEAALIKDQSNRYPIDMLADNKSSENKCVGLSLLGKHHHNTANIEDHPILNCLKGTPSLSHHHFEHVTTLVKYCKNPVVDNPTPIVERIKQLEKELSEEKHQVQELIRQQSVRVKQEEQFGNASLEEVQELKDQLRAVKHRANQEKSAHQEEIAKINGQAEKGFKKLIDKVEEAKHTKTAHLEEISKIKSQAEEKHKDLKDQLEKAMLANATHLGEIAKINSQAEEERKDLKDQLEQVNALHLKMIADINSQAEEERKDLKDQLGKANVANDVHLKMIANINSQAEEERKVLKDQLGAANRANVVLLGKMEEIKSQAEDECKVLRDRLGAETYRANQASASHLGKTAKIKFQAKEELRCERAKVADVTESLAAAKLQLQTANDNLINNEERFQKEIVKLKNDIEREKAGHQQTRETCKSLIQNTRKSESDLLTKVLEQNAVGWSTHDLHLLLISMNHRLTEIKERVSPESSMAPSSAQILFELIQDFHAKDDGGPDRKFYLKGIADLNKELLELEEASTFSIVSCTADECVSTGTATGTGAPSTGKREGGSKRPLEESQEKQEGHEGSPTKRLRSSNSISISP